MSETRKHLTADQLTEEHVGETVQISGSLVHYTLTDVNPAGYGGRIRMGLRGERGHVVTEALPDTIIFIGEA